MGKLADLGIEVSEAVIDNVAVSSILETIGDHDLKSVPIDLLKDLPILRTLAVSCSIRDIVFMSKLKSFLRSLDDLPKDKIRHEIEKIDKSKKYRQKVGENIINLIDQSFDDDSAENIALLFRTFLKEQISYDEFMASSRIVCKLSREDILRFCGDFTYLANVSMGACCRCRADAMTFFRWMQPFGSRIRSRLEEAGLPVETGPFVTVSCASGDRVRADLLLARYPDALCENMEGAALALAAAHFGLPFAELRCVSNVVDEPERQHWCLQAACARCGEVAALLFEEKHAWIP